MVIFRVKIPNLHCIALNTQKSVGASLLAIAVYQPTFLSLTHRYREQARSHRVSIGLPYAQAISRNSRRRILPTGVIGNDSRKTMCLGIL